MDRLRQDFTHLNDYSITSPTEISYNCIAWAANEDTRWWWPAQGGRLLATWDSQGE